MRIDIASDQAAWDAFLSTQTFSPFLQSWTMGEVYKRTNQEVIRLETRNGNDITGICMAVVVPAKRGRHLSIPYGPVVDSLDTLPLFIEALKEEAKKHRCSFIRLSPFLSLSKKQEWKDALQEKHFDAPLHLLAEHIWYLPLTMPDLWLEADLKSNPTGTQRTEEEIMNMMRKNTRNLIRRAKREGVEIIRSEDPLQDIEHYLTLHEETRKRHKFTPYTDAFFRAQLEEFSKRGETTLYMAKYRDEVIASSIHMHIGGETSYHHGASTHKYPKIPASYLLQWEAICDALKRGDHTYNFWGISPMEPSPNGDGERIAEPKHPFAGVTLFKTGFGGKLCNLVHCTDIPVHPSYYATRAFEQLRKWKRGF